MTGESSTPAGRAQSATEASEEEPGEEQTESKGSIMGLLAKHDSFVRWKCVQR